MLTQVRYRHWLKVGISVLCHFSHSLNHCSQFPSSFFHFAMPPKTPALHRTVKKPQLSGLGFTGTDVRALLRTNELIMIEARTPELVFLEDFAKSKGSITVDTDYLVEFFQLIHSFVPAVTPQEDNNHVTVFLPHLMNPNQNNLR
jgi:hypothetical protein